MSSRPSTPLMNSVLLGVSLTLSAALAWIIYWVVITPPTPVVAQGNGSEYTLGFYNSQGQRIGAGGELKLLLDPFTLYRNYPNQHTASYRIGPFGFRAGHSNNTAHSAFVLGGSLVFGQGLSDDSQTLSAQLDRRHPDWQVINAGVVGFLSGQELALMTHYLGLFEADLYIVVDGWNDLFDPYMYTRQWPAPPGPLGFNNTFFQLGERLADQHRQQHGATPTLVPPYPELSEDQHFDLLVGSYQRNLTQMDALARSRGAEFLVVFQPELGAKQQPSDTEAMALEEWDRAYGYLQRDIPGHYARLIERTRDYLDQRGIAYLDLRSAPTLLQHPDTLFLDPVHLNAAGHKLMADLIQTRLAEL